MGRFEYFEGRTFTVYEQGMNATFNIKWRQIMPWITAKANETIVDEGCGTGQMLVALARKFPKAVVLGRDMSSHLLKQSRETTGGCRNVFVLNCDILRSQFPENSISTKIFSSIWHELYSYNGYREEVLREALRNSLRELRPGGRIIIRDGIKPAQETFALWLSKKQESGNPSPSEMFKRFRSDFHPIQPVIARTSRTIDGTPFWLIQSDLVYEFLMKKDYIENWDGEVKEVFGIWTKDEYVTELERAGFIIRCARPYRNPWIVNNRLRGKTKLWRFSKRGRFIRAAFPYTNILIVGEKPLTR